MKPASLFLTLVAALVLPACTAEAETLPSEPPAKDTPAKSGDAQETVTADLVLGRVP